MGFRIKNDISHEKIQGNIQLLTIRLLLFINQILTEIKIYFFLIYNL
jgi:hypothetical protein